MNIPPYNPMFNPAPFTPDEIIRAMRHTRQTGMSLPATREAQTQGLITFRPMFGVWEITERGRNYITGYEENTSRPEES